MSKNDLHPIEASQLHAKRERVFLVLAGLFLGSMTMLNILGISRFIKLYSLDYSMANGASFTHHVRPSRWSFAISDHVSVHGFYQRILRTSARQLGRDGGADAERLGGVHLMAGRGSAGL